MELEASVLVTQLEDGYSAYLDNTGDMMGVDNDKIYGGGETKLDPMVFTTGYHLLCGNDEQELTDLQVVSVSPATEFIEVQTDKSTGTITILAKDGLDFVHAGNEYKVRVKGTCYGLTRGHASNPTYLAAEFTLQGIAEAADGISFRLALTKTFIAKDGHGDFKEESVDIDASVIFAKTNGELSVMSAEEMKHYNLYLDYAVDDTELNNKSQSPITIQGVGSSIKPNKAITVRLWGGDKQIDAQDIYVVQDGTNNVRIDLDNENDSMLYNGQNVKASKNIISHIKVYDGSDDVTSQTKLDIEKVGCNAELNGTTITVTELTENNASVTVVGVYRDETYRAVLTLSKKINTDKYDLAITPNDIAYNTTSKVCSTENIKVEVYRTYINANSNAETVLCKTLPNGFKLRENGKDVAYANSGYTLSKVDCENTPDYRYELLNKDGGVEDYETIPINRTTNLTISKLDVKYGLSNTDTDMPTEWKDEVPTLTQGQWLWSWTYIKYSDNTEANTYSKTYQGMDIFSADLDNEMSAIPCKQGGNPLFSKIVKTKVSYYKGSNIAKFKISKVICPVGITCGSSYNGEYTSAKELEFNIGTNANLSSPQDVSISCTDTEGENVRTVVMTIVGVLGTASYELVVSTQEVVYNPNASKNQWSPSSVSVSSLTKEENGLTPTSVTTVPSGYRLWYGTNDNNPTQSVAEGGNVSGASINLASTVSSIDFYLCANNSTTFSASNVVDKERVWVVSGGVDGKSLTNVKNYYKWGTSGTTAPTGDYTETIPTHEYPNDYLWNYEVCYNNNDEIITESDKTCVGYFPKGIQAIKELYKLTNTDAAPGAPILTDNKKDFKDLKGWGEDKKQTDSTNRWLWNVEAVQMTDDVWSLSAVHTAGVQGLDGKSYEGTSEFYYASASDDASKLPAHTKDSHADWKNKTSELTNKFSEAYPYLWNFEIVEMKLSNGTTTQTATTPEMISYWGQDGDTGKGITGIDERYRANTGETPTGDPTASDKINSKDAKFSAANPYLWNNQRVIYDTDPVTYGSWSGWQQISYWGQDGTSVYFADLDNEMDSIVTDKDGNVANNANGSKATVTLKTNVALYYGITDITDTSDTGITFSAVSGIKSSHSGKACSFVCTPNDMADKSEVTITIKGTGNHKDVSRQVVFTISKVKTGAAGAASIIYYLVPSESAIKIDKNGNYNVTTITCDKMKQEGNSEGKVTTDLTLKMSIDGDAEQAYASITLATTKPTKNITYSLYSGSTLYDRETVPVIKDGTDGNNGTSPILADLDNEMDSVITGADGKLSTAVTLKTNVYLYKGTSPMNITDVTFSCATTGITWEKSIAADNHSAECRITVGTAFNADKAEVKITVKSSTESRDLTFTINRVKTGGKGDNAVVYSLNPDNTVIKVAKDNTLTPTATATTGICCYVNKTDGTNPPTKLSSLSDKWTMKVGKDGAEPSAYTIGSHYYSYTKNNKSVEFYLYYDGTMIDKETIPIVADGINGTSPVRVDIDNEMTSVACDVNGKVVAASSIMTTTYLYVGSTKQTITNITHSTLPTGITKDDNTSKPSIKFNIAKDCDLSASKEITLTITAGSYSGTAVMTINGIRPGANGDNAVVYEILPSASAVSVPKNGTSLGNPSPSTLTAKIQKVNGTSISELDGTSTDNNTIKLYCRKNDTGDWKEYPSAGISISNTDSKVVFELRKYGKTDVLDRETVPVVKDGINGIDGEDGSDAPSISFGVTCHNGSKDQSNLEYIKINGKSVGNTNKFVIYYENGVMKRTQYANSAIAFSRGTTIFFINSKSMIVTEYDNADTYANPELISNLFNTVDWYRDNVDVPCIILLITTDAASFTQEARDRIKQYGGMASGTYDQSRKRHYFVGCTKGLSVGQGYEEISDTPTLKEVTIPIVPGVGIVANGIQGAEGLPGINGCAIRYFEWDSTGNTTYYNDSGATTPRKDANAGGATNTTRWIDIVQRKGYDGAMHAYVVKPVDGQSASSNKQPYISGTNDNANTTNGWIETQYQPILATNVLLAKNANIEMTQGNALLLQCNGTTSHFTAGASGGVHNSDGTHSGYAFWAGTSSTSAPSSTQIGDAPYNVTHEGKLKASEAEISGILKATALQLNPAKTGVTSIKPENGTYYNQYNMGLSSSATLELDFNNFSQDDCCIIYLTTHRTESFMFGDSTVETVVDFKNGTLAVDKDGVPQGDNPLSEVFSTLSFHKLRIMAGSVQLLIHKKSATIISQTGYAMGYWKVTVSGNTGSSTKIHEIGVTHGCWQSGTT